MSNPISVTLTFNTAKEVADFFANATGNVQRVIATGTGATTEHATQRDTNDAAPKTTKANPPAPAKAEPAGEAIDRAIVSKAAVALAIKDKAKAVAILAEHDVKAVKDLPDDQLGAVHAKLVAAMGE